MSTFPKSYSKYLNFGALIFYSVSILLYAYMISKCKHFDVLQMILQYTRSVPTIEYVFVLILNVRHNRALVEWRNNFCMRTYRFS